MSNENEAREAAVDFDALVRQATNAFFDMMQERHNKGQEKYGPIKFMDVNTLIEAMEEVVDLANYALYTFIKLWILNMQVQKLQVDTPDLIGPQSFMKG